jgi:hypothetical protein
MRAWGSPCGEKLLANAHKPLRAWQDDLAVALPSQLGAHSPHLFTQRAKRGYA